MPAGFTLADISRYYDRHTASFLRFGQGRGSIHRAVWGAGTSTRDEAFHYVEDRIAALVRPRLRSSSDVHVIDLGCGVGASLCYLAARLPIRGTGITLSPAQAVLARQRIAAAGLSGRVECLEGDFCDPPAALAPADLACAIESFVHTPAPGRFFERCHRLVKPGGHLVVCDDVKRRTTSPHAARVVGQFMKGWHVNALLEREEIVSLARAAGFEHESTDDLTPMLEIRRVRDRAVAIGLSVLGRLPIGTDRFDYLVGGTALQTCLARGWVGYELSVFRRSS